jgi:DNA repair exonuclease SbcCD ATPase subunit
MQRWFEMMIVFVLLSLLIAIPASGQAAGQGAFDPQAFEDQAKQILAQLQQPDVDQQQVMQQAGQLMQQFRDATQNMTPDQVDKIRQQMMERLQPEIIKAMPSIVRQMQRGLMDRLKQQLECTDEEFAALQPALQKVLDCMQAATVGGRRGGFGGFSLPGQSATLAQAIQKLHTTLEDTAAKPDEIKAKLDAVREAKASTNHDLQVARAELRPLLTVRQEAVLVANGLLD